MALLTVENLTMRFGGLTAVDALTFSVAERTIHGLIGPNGAGKSTVFNCLSRFYTPQAGAIVMDGKELLKQPAHAVIRLGVARTFQNVELFRGMSVLDNVMVGQHTGFGGSFLTDMLGFGRGRAEEKARRQKALATLELLGIAGDAFSYVGALPYGKQKKVEFARALVSQPKLLLLDEPAAGLNPQETHALGDLIVRLRDELGITVLLVEHDMSLVMRVCDAITVMEFGRRIATGRPEEIRCNEAVIKAYLGEGEASA